MVDRFQGDTPNQDHTFYSMSKREEKLREKEVDQVLSGEPQIYERNPDTDEVKTRRRIEPVKEPIYVNEMVEAVETLKRIESKLQYICEVGVNKNDTTSYTVWKEYNK